MKQLILVAVLCSACGSSSPTAPSSPPPPVVPPVQQTVTITGHVTATNGGQPLAGVSAALGTTNATTDGSGSFSTSMPPQGFVGLTLTGSGIVPRYLNVAVTASRDVTVNAIALGGGFDLGFYRRFVRNDFDTPGALQPLRRWTQAPRIYLRTVDDAGEPIHGPTLNSIEPIARESIPLWTNGQFGVAEFQRGTETREGVAGWITIKWPSPGTQTRCGRADIGVSGGTVELEYHNPQCRCTNAVTAPRTVRHELGHAMGLYHTGDNADVMSGLTWPLSICDAQPSARERYHAAIAYSRPVGNSDPDSDPFGIVNLAPLRIP